MRKHAAAMRDVPLDVAAQPLSKAFTVEVPAAGARTRAFGTRLKSNDVVGEKNLRLFHTAIVAAGCDRPGQSRKRGRVLITVIKTRPQFRYVGGASASSSSSSS